MLGEGDLACPLDELLGLKAIVKVQLDLLQSLQHALLIVDGLEPELVFLVLLLVDFALDDLHIAVHRGFVGLRD